MNVGPHPVSAISNTIQCLHTEPLSDAKLPTRRDHLARSRRSPHDVRPPGRRAGVGALSLVSTHREERARLTARAPDVRFRVRVRRHDNDRGCLRDDDQRARHRAPSRQALRHHDSQERRRRQGHDARLPTDSSTLSRSVRSSARFTTPRRRCHWAGRRAARRESVHLS
jgi:hypothetical protein